MNSPRLYVLAYDLHFPYHDRASWRAVLDFLSHNRIDGFVFGGDQLHLDSISHWTKGKPVFRPRGSLLRDIRAFDRDILSEVEKHLPPDAERVWLTGNHERFLDDVLEEQPELDGALSLDSMLGLLVRGWRVVPLGGEYRIGHLHVIHGDGIGGGQNPAKKAVETYCANVVLGHHHCAQSFTKCSPAKDSKRWIGYVIPTLGTLAPAYGRGRPNNHLHGFGIVECWGAGLVNTYTAIINNGAFSFGGRIYGR